jgi:2'-5' RNA ligase
MRLFVAVVPPEPALEDLEEFLAPRRESAPQLRWTVQEQWHVTLAFMPDVDARDLDELCERLGRAAARRTPMRLSLGGGGAFPNPGRAKVLYAGVHAEQLEELRRLAVGSRAAANKAGAEVGGGGFRAHVTLARSGRPFEATKLLRVLDGYHGPEWAADEVTLIESHLGEGPRKRPRYELLDAFPLGRAGLSSAS